MQIYAFYKNESREGFAFPTTRIIRAVTYRCKKFLVYFTTMRRTSVLEPVRRRTTTLPWCRLSRFTEPFT